MISSDAIDETDHSPEAKNHLRKLYSAFLVSVKRVFVYHGVPQLINNSMSGEVGRWKTIARFYLISFPKRLPVVIRDLLSSFFVRQVYTVILDETVYQP
jgi:hypothetical protein